MRKPHLLSLSPIASVGCEMDREPRRKGLISDRSQISLASLLGQSERELAQPSWAFTDLNKFRGT